MPKVLFENDAVRCEDIDGFAVYQLTTDAIELIIDITLKRSYYEFSQKLMSDETIKGIMYINHIGSVDRHQYADKVKEITDSSDMDDRKTFEMLFNANLEYAQRYLGCAKPTASGIVGSVGYDYLGFSMLHNYCCISEDMVFNNTLHTHGIPPTPIFSYFLKRSVGKSVASDILYIKDTLHPQEAKEHGLVNDVVSKDAVQDKCLTALETMARIPKESFAVMQDFERQDLPELEEHIQDFKKAKLQKIMYK